MKSNKNAGKKALWEDFLKENEEFRRNNEKNGGLVQQEENSRGEQMSL